MQNAGDVTHGVERRLLSGVVDRLVRDRVRRAHADGRVGVDVVELVVLRNAARENQMPMSRAQSHTVQLT